MPARRLSRRAAVAVAVLLAAFVPAGSAQAARGDRPDTVLAVPAGGAAVTTTFVTSQVGTYTLVVSGTFVYKAGGGLADCGHHDVNDGVLAQDWRPATGLLIDGSPANCGRYADEHTYVVTVDGTGERMAFSIAPDPTGYADNAGALTVAIVTESDLDGTCVYEIVTLPNSNSAYVTVAAEASQNGAGIPGTSTHVLCDVTVGGIPAARVDAEMLGPATAGFAWSERVQLGPVQRCLTVTIYGFFGQPILTRAFPCVG